jgi:hypothetical protein
MFDTFEGNMEGCYLYSAIPSNLYLDKAMAAMEGTQKQQMYPLRNGSHHTYFIAIMELRPHCFK